MTDEPLLRLIDILDRIGVEYMLTGSYASNVYGRVRSTFDADFVILLQSKQMEQLVKNLGKDFYFDARDMREVREMGGQFNAIHSPSGLKIDFYLSASDEYSRQAFRRKISQKLWGRNVSLISPEDLVLAKLGWAKRGNSQRQIEDAAGIYQTQKDALDMAYLEKWAAYLEVSDLLRQAMDKK